MQVEFTGEELLLMARALRLACDLEPEPAFRDDMTALLPKVAWTADMVVLEELRAKNGASERKEPKN